MHNIFGGSVPLYTFHACFLTPISPHLSLDSRTMASGVCPSQTQEALAGLLACGGCQVTRIRAVGTDSC